MILKLLATDTSRFCLVASKDSNFKPKLPCFPELFLKNTFFTKQICHYRIVVKRLLTCLTYRSATDYYKVYTVAYPFQLMNGRMVRLFITALPVCMGAKADASKRAQISNR